MNPANVNKTINKVFQKPNIQINTAIKKNANANSAPAFVFLSFSKILDSKRSITYLPSTLAVVGSTLVTLTLTSSTMIPVYLSISFLILSWTLAMDEGISTLE